MPKKKNFDLDFLEMINQVHSNNLNVLSREIYIHGHYSSNDEDAGIEYKMATQFVKNLHLLNQISAEPVLVHMQCPGGDWVHGMAMYDAIQSVSSPVSILGYGEVSSMSSILLQVAKKRVLMPNCEFVIHRGFLSLDGVTTTVQTNAEWNKKTDFAMLCVYARKAVHGEYFQKKNMNENDVVIFIDQKIKDLGDWILSASEAVHYGFADGILGSENYETLSKLRD